MKNKKTVVVGMSGGVDSSVTAALLSERAYNVIGVMLRLWSESGREDENRCCTVDALRDARLIAGQLDIPFYAVDARDRFRAEVVDYFIDGYTKGITPNPCLVCNRTIRWGFLYNYARTLGADYLATGHYARLRRPEGGPIQLLRGVDRSKDQSYVLHVLTQEQLEHTLFPLGEYTKVQVRELAQQFDLPVAERPDSQDLCFVGEDNYQNFLRRQAPQVHQKGPILSPQGKKLGEHPGLAYFTIGQRKGIGIAYAEPLYVLEKDLERNALIVGPKSALGKKQLTAHQVNWISGHPPQEPLRASVKIRYRAREVKGLVTPVAADRVRVDFEEALPDITPGQSAVFYQQDQCLGGGVIQP